ncbi:hypothetical protein HHK36_013008 [Tetracentron sinense]|uniref:Uncharacterized protein n=1 Tax=Tetracentron sinense TaxID=13715 RepID=A0A834ZA40_TETSI|nr:hypothetical protein HHK36_013008 [Tetracentron sinense]
MQYKNLGRSRLNVSQLSYGAWVSFGNQLDVKEAKSLLQSNAAEVYASGRTEEIMGQAIRELGWKRSDIVVSTKIFWGGPGHESGPEEKNESRLGGNGSGGGSGIGSAWGSSRREGDSSANDSRIGGISIRDSRLDGISTSDSGAGGSSTRDSRAVGNSTRGSGAGGSSTRDLGADGSSIGDSGAGESSVRDSRAGGSSKRDSGACGSSTSGLGADGSSTGGAGCYMKANEHINVMMADGVNLFGKGKCPNMRMTIQVLIDQSFSSPVADSLEDVFFCNLLELMEERNGRIFVDICALPLIQIKENMKAIDVIPFLTPPVLEKIDAIVQSKPKHQESFSGVTCYYNLIPQAAWQKLVQGQEKDCSLPLPSMPSRLVTGDDLNAFCKAMQIYEVSNVGEKRKSEYLGGLDTQQYVPMKING